MFNGLQDWMFLLEHCIIILVKDGIPGNVKFPIIKGYMNALLKYNIIPVIILM